MTTHRNTSTPFPGPAAKDKPRRNRTQRRRQTRSEIVFHTVSSSTLTPNAPPGVPPTLRVRMRRAR